MIVLRPLWAWIVMGVIAFLTMLFTLRDELLPTHWREVLRLDQLASSVPWYWTAIVTLICLIAVIVEGSFRAHTEMDDRISTLDSRLELIGLERPVAFQTVELQRVFPLGENRFIITRIAVLIHNSSNRMMSFRLRTLFFDIGGVRAEFTGAQEGFLNPETDTGITGDLSPAVSVPAFPLSVTVYLVLEYDNLPAVSPRIMALDVRYTFDSFDPLVWSNVILRHAEQ